MKNTLFALSAVLVLCAAAPPIREVAIDFIEAQVKRPDGWHIGTRDTAVKLDGVVYIDQRAANPGSLGGCDGGPGICFTGKGVLVWDFQSLTNSPVGNQQACAEALNAGTATGCRFGDTVMLGIDQAPVNALGNIDAYVSAADSFKVRACADGITDGGAFDMPDASYTVRCFR